MRKIALLLFNALIAQLSIAQWEPNGNTVYYNLGHVGIGTSSPSTHWGKVLQVYDYNNAALSVKTPVADWQIITAANGGLDFRDITGGGNAGRFFIASNGNVGIGTTNPVAKLHVLGGQIIETSGSSSNSRTLTLMNAGTNQLNLEAYNGPWRSAIQIQNNNATKALFFAPPESDYNYSIIRSVNGGVKLDVGGTATDVGINAITIEPNGNIGIGTTTPQKNLHVQGTTRANSFVTDVDNSSFSGDYQFNTSGTYRGRFLWYSSSYYPGIPSNSITVENSTGFPMAHFLENGNVAFTGNVGIGTNTPQAKLAVNGDIFSKKVRVTQTGWPDYVFHPSYKLLPLNDLERYIKKNRHLPEIPSAQEVEEKGLDLGDNQALLLKKIEELTLYIIAQDKKIEEQDKQIESQHDAIKDLKIQNKELAEIKSDLEVIKAKLKN